MRWLPIDLDPGVEVGQTGVFTRRSGFSATDAEVKAAVDLGQEITAWMEGEMGFSRAVRAFSGNGLHLMYRIPDLPNDAEHRELVKRAIGVIAAKFTSDRVDVDVKTVNPARIWKLYGTTGRKGDSTPDRPHRRSYIYEGQVLGLGEG